MALIFKTYEAPTPIKFSADTSSDTLISYKDSVNYVDVGNIAAQLFNMA